MTGMVKGASFGGTGRTGSTRREAPSSISSVAIRGDGQISGHKLSEIAVRIRFPFLNR